MNVQGSFHTWMELLGGVLAIGVVGLVAAIIEQKRRRSR